MIVPGALRGRVLELAHEGHLGIVRTKQRCRDFVWCLALDRQVEQLVRNCKPCIVSGKSCCPRVAPIQPTQWLRGPWLEIQVDIFGELVIAPREHRFPTVVHDLYSKWLEICSTAQVRASDVISFLEDLFVRWGLPVSITTDNGPQFRSHDFKQWLKGHGVRHVTTPLYHPQGNAGGERFNQVIKQGLRHNWQARNLWLTH